MPARSHLTRLAAPLLALGLAIGCGDAGQSTEADADAGADAAADTRGEPTERCPHGEYEGICLPALPVFEDWECPEGWLSVPGFTDSEGVENVPEGMSQFMACEPPPLPEDCPLGWMPRIGETECVRQGVECPEEGALWHDEETIRAQAPEYEGAIVYVSPDGTDEGDGSRDAPLGRIGRALVVAGAGGIVAVSAGEFAEKVVLNGRSAVVGSCVEGTTIVAPSATEADSTVEFSGASANAQLSDLSVTGERIGVLFNGTVERNVVARVVVREAMGVGVIAGRRAQGVALEDVVVRDTREMARDDTSGYGVTVQEGATLSGVSSSPASSWTPPADADSTRTAVTAWRRVHSDTMPKAGSTMMYTSG